MPEHPTPAKPLRILHVLDVLSLSGMEYGVIKQVNRLDPARFAPHICCLRFQRDATRPFLSDDVPVAELKRGEGWDLRLIGRLARVMREWNIDVVHSHNWQTYLYSVLAARRAGIAAVIHGEHGRESTRPSAKRILASRWLARRLAGVTTVSRDLERELVELWKLAPHRVATIANGVELERFTDAPDTAPLRRELELEPAHRVVMTVGRLRPVKDHPTLLRAFARVHAELPAARLVLLGTDFGTGVLEKLEAQARELGIGEATRFPGIRSEVPEFLSLADAYVNCSIFEGMSNTILEAMAAGKPVVATAVGGNPELVHEGKTGFLVPPRDDRALGDRLREILADPALARRLGDGGREHVRRWHTMERMVRLYGELYEECHARARLTRVAGSRSIKPWLSRGARWSGANRIRGGLAARTLNILTYHRVLPLPRALRTSFGAMMMPRDEFEAQMAHLGREWNVLPLEEAVARVSDGTLPARAVSITFDDGYRDNYEYAWPVLEKYGIPATIFVVTGAVDGGIRLWWEEVDEILCRLSADAGGVGSFENLPEWLGPALGELPGLADRRPAIRRLVDRMNALPGTERTRILDALRALDGEAHARLSDLMLTWDQIREMADAGASFGAHTVSHAFMDELDDDDARREIENSIETLRTRLGREVSSFSFPRGRASEDARRLLREAGIRVAVTTVSGSNRAGVDPLQLRRLDSGYCRAPSGFDRTLFEAELTGWFHPLRGG